MTLNIVEVLRNRELERDNKIIDRALRPYVIHCLAADPHGAHILPALAVAERVHAILGRLGYELAEVE